MNENLKQMIEELPVDEKAKEFLKRADVEHNLAREEKRNSLMVPLLVAGEGCGLSDYGRVYSAIVDASGSLPVVEGSSYLELALPKDNEEDLKKFFASPDVEAWLHYKNRFYGTELVSFKDYSAEDLMENRLFGSLLDFFDRNKENIRFVFHVTPDFSLADTNRLAAGLRKVFNLVETIDLGTIGVEKGYVYVIDNLAARKVMIDEETRQYFRERALPDMVARKSYRGFRTLDALLDRMSLESAVAAKDGKRNVNLKVLNCVMDQFMNEEEAERYEPHRIGFGFQER